MFDNDQKINHFVNTTNANLSALADVNMVIGTPITTASGYQVIPFSKVTMGNLAGGGEYGDVKVVKEANAFPFSGGGGAVVSMKPMGFLIDDGKGCHIIRITDEPMDNLIEHATEILREVFSKE